MQHRPYDMDDALPLVPQASGSGSDGSQNDVKEVERTLQSAPSGLLQERRERKRIGDGCCGRIANNERFQHVTLFVIVLNAFWIFVDVQWNHSALKLEDGRLPLEPYSTIVENIFCVYFTLEVVIRFLAFKKFRYCFIDAWFIFDFTLVLFMVLETWALPLLDLASGGSNDGGGVLSNFSSFRLLRLLRLTRVARLMRFFPELLTLVKGMVRAMQSVVFILLFMVVVTYVFAIVFTSQIAEYDYVPPPDSDPTAKDLFGDMGSSMMTLFTNGVLVDNLVFTLTEIQKESLILMWAFMVFIVVSGMTLFNMLIGVLCQVIEDSSQGEAEARQLAELKTCLVDAFQAMDESQDGLISKEEWAQISTNKKVQAALLKLGVEESMMEERLKQMQESLFGRQSNGGDDAENGEVEAKEGLSFDEFVEQVVELRMDQPASALDVETLMSSLTQEHRVLQRRLAYMESELKKVVHGTQDPPSSSSRKRAMSQGSDREEDLVTAKSTVFGNQALLDTHRSVDAMASQMEGEHMASFLPGAPLHSEEPMDSDGPIFDKVEACEARSRPVTPRLTEARTHSRMTTDTEGWLQEVPTELLFHILKIRSVAVDVEDVED